ncbi:hypothetical protein ACFQIA_23090 [Halalkalicoccus sp. GCM10025704]
MLFIDDLGSRTNNGRREIVVVNFFDDVVDRDPHEIVDSSTNWLYSRRIAYKGTTDPEGIF